jgi:hypothetical protein
MTDSALRELPAGFFRKSQTMQFMLWAGWAWQTESGIDLTQTPLPADNRTTTSRVAKDRDFSAAG